MSLEIVILQVPEMDMHLDYMKCGNPNLHSLTPEDYDVLCRFDESHPTKTGFRRSRFAQLRRATTSSDAALCTICFNDDEDKDKVMHMVQLDCHHYFCTSCIWHWLSCHDIKCPLCKTPVQCARKSLADDMEAHANEPDVGVEFTAGDAAQLVPRGMLMRSFFEPRPDEISEPICDESIVDSKDTEEPLQIPCSILEQRRMMP